MTASTGSGVFGEVSASAGLCQLQLLPHVPPGCLLGAKTPHQSQQGEGKGFVEMGAGSRTPFAHLPGSPSAQRAQDPSSSAIRALLGQVSHLGWCHCRRQRLPAGWRPPAATPRWGSASSPKPRRRAPRESAATDSKLRVPLDAPRESQPLIGPESEPLRSSRGRVRFQGNPRRRWTHLREATPRDRNARPGPAPGHLPCAAAPPAPRTLARSPRLLEPPAGGVERMRCPLWNANSRSAGTTG